MDELTKQIGRALVVGIRGDGPDSALFREDLECCVQACVGGVVLFDRDLPTGGLRNIRSAAQVRELTTCLRESLGDDLLIMIDQEGGNVARLGADSGFESGLCAPAFARLGESAQIVEARAQAAQLADLGINVNLAPVVDLAIAERSAVITGLERSFGAESHVVIGCARRWISAHLEAGVASCCKHFPGHGSAIGDTHEGLVDITGRATLQQELEPYRAIAKDDGVLMMTGHLLDRAIDPDLPASLSGAHTEGTLRQEIGFDGLVVTDSVDMGAISTKWSCGEASVLALTAGADLIMDGANAAGEVRRCPAMEMSRDISAAIRQGRIPDGPRRLDDVARRIGLLLGSLRRRD